MILYAEIVQSMKEASMDRAMNEEIGDPANEEDVPDESVGIVTDARHAQRRNSHRSDIMALGQINHRVLAHMPVTKKEQTCTQKHEKVGTERLYRQLDEMGVKVSDHAHDRNQSINKFIRERPPYADGTRTTNSNDTWHATKAIARKFKRVSSGPVRSRGVSWHPQLADKGAPLKTHFYWCMARCGGDEQVLRDMLLNIVQHYQNRHDNCHPESRCRADPNYRPTKLLLTEQRAVELLTNFVRSQDIYKSAKDYVLCKDTLYVESFNNSCLQYVDKRIVFGDLNYGLRMGLAVLDWNEHVDREATSRYVRYSVANIRQVQGKRILTAKKYTFVRELLLTFLARVKAAGNLPPLPQRQPQPQREDGALASGSDNSDTDFSAEDEPE
ncbi:PREDICTED: uncharacterized protein LOC109476627 [Branchiostoma belcheri]|uniref:Uncharacterized protein LOC109476627 n=1 Tax=Branchiostoma belcheri TaxID=7741 RepID=A0A6P4ZGR2_BRABE|nr:PREDICTED: uncharacterized protein LOC109476627 [Branchiostoma belcheri]